MNFKDGILIEPWGGLANRLRVIFGAQLFCRAQGKELYINWAHKDCHKLRRQEVTGSHFLDVFRPIQQIHFLNEGDMPTEEAYFYKGTDPSKFRESLGDSNFTVHHRSLYKQLCPIDFIREKVDKFKEKKGAYNAIHIRRTDHLKWLKALNKSPEPLSKFEEFIEKFPQRRVFLATDDYAAQAFFKKKYSPLIYYNQALNKNKKNLRATSLQDAVIEACIAAGSEAFLGTRLSSFSGLIKILKEQQV